MIDERTIDGDQFEPFHVTLREQQSIEWITGGRLWIDGVEDVRDFNPEYLQAN